MRPLAAFQLRFAEALFDASAPVPRHIRGARRHRAERRFAVYRNNAVASLVNALGARYPATRQLVGEDSFRLMARVYTIQEPPRSPILLHYGESFPRFIRGLGRMASIDYLADVADLEWARGRAYHAADAAPLGADAFARLDRGRLAEITVVFHPSASLLASQFPVVSIWESCQAPGEAGSVTRWGAEAALVARPHLQVEITRLPKGGHAFLHALVDGATMAQAADAGLAAAAECDLAENLMILIRANIVIGVGHKVLIAA